jgi:hypothetical protein
MEVREKYKNQLGELIARLIDARTTSAAEPVRFHAAQFALITSVLESAVDFHPNIPEADRSVLVREALLAAGKEAKPDQKQLEKHLRSGESKYLRTPSEDYVLTSAIGIANYHGRRRIRINDVKISLCKTVPTIFDRTEIQDDIKEYAAPPPPDTLQILARVSARTPSAAFEEAQRNIELLRALWNYTLNFPRWLFFPFGGVPKPVNAILPGRLHTLHRPDGSLIRAPVWYEPQGFKDGDIYLPDDGWSRVQKGAIQTLSRPRRIKYRSDLELAFVRYSRALDDRDHHAAFGRIWAVLEYLTECISNYDRLIKRASFIAANPEHRFIRLMLQHLRDVRNDLVHEDQSRSNVEAYLYQAKRIAEFLIRFHLRNGTRFSSRAAAAEYLDTPADPDILKRRIQDYRRVLRQRKKGSSPQGNQR